MTRAAQIRCLFYAAIALAALYGTWSNNLAYMMPNGAAHGASFIGDLFVNHAAKSITLDLSLLMLACAVLMVTEARRLGIRLVWLYLVFAFLIAISVTFPLFLIARERRIASGAPASRASAPILALDAAGLALLAALAAYSLYMMRG